VDVFISYSSADRAIADQIVATFEGAGVLCWVAHRDIRAGEDYRKAIMNGLCASRVLVVIVSAKSVKSRHVANELSLAFDRNLRLVPFRIEPVAMGEFEYDLTRTHWLDAFTPPLGPHLALLRDEVQRMLEVDHTTPLASRSARSAELPRRPKARVSEVSPDAWWQRPGGRIKQFLQRFVEDPEA
jgi:hypothetical protein